MERLTERYGNNEVWVKQHDYIAASRKLADYEDLEEQGRLIKLPCKIGDTVWYFETECDTTDCDDYDDYCYRGCKKIRTPKVKEGVVEGFLIYNVMKSDDTIVVDNTIIVNKTTTWENVYLRFSDVGKTVFLTKEEAEHALERMKGEK